MRYGGVRFRSTGMGRALRVIRVVWNGQEIG